MKVASELATLVYPEKRGLLKLHRWAGAGMARGTAKRGGAAGQGAPFRRELNKASFKTICLIS